MAFNLKDSGSASTVATLVAMLMIAVQIASKATRDALFLSNFDVSKLPLMLIAAAGGLVGGLLGERVAADLTISTMLPHLACTQAACAVALFWFGRGMVEATESGTTSKPEERNQSGLRTVLAQPYLRSLAVLALP